jgi:uncharacterized repeat protein (TIGR01451 family)
MVEMIASGELRRRVYLVGLVGIATALLALLLGVSMPERAQAASAEEICQTAEPVYWLVFLETGEVRSTTPPGDAAISYLVDGAGFHWTNNSDMDVYRIAVRVGGPDENIMYDAPGLPNPVPLDETAVAVKLCFDDGTLPTTTTTSGETTTTTSGETTTTTSGETTTTTSGEGNAPDIDIEKEADSAFYSEDGVATFTITVTNPGPLDLFDVVVTDQPALDVDPGSDCPRAIGDLAVGQSVQYECTVSGLDGVSPFDNTATATGEDDQGRQVTDEDSASVNPQVLNTTVTTSSSSTTSASSSTTSDTLPVTGADVENVALVGAILTGFGLALLTASATRRRREG